ncbi:MAG: flagellar protein FliO/FliZ [Glaciecola sp.]
MVIAIIFALAYIMRRFNVAQTGGGQMRVVASMMAGAKEKVMVIEVGGEQHLLGITAHNINHLAKLENPIQKDKQSAALNANPSASSGGKFNFQQKLVNAMAQGIAGSKTSKDTNKQAAKGVDHD